MCVIRVAKHMRLPLALHRAQGTFGWAWHWRPPSPRRHRLSTGPGQVGASKYIMYRPSCQVRHAFLTSSRFVLRPRTAIGLSREPQPSSPGPEDQGPGTSGCPSRPLPQRGRPIAHAALLVSTCPRRRQSASASKPDDASARKGSSASRPRPGHGHPRNRARCVSSTGSGAACPWPRRSELWRGRRMSPSFFPEGLRGWSPRRPAGQKAAAGWPWPSRRHQEIHARVPSLVAYPGLAPPSPAATPRCCCLPTCRISGTWSWRGCACDDGFIAFANAHSRAPHR